MSPNAVFSNRVTKLFNIKYPIIQAGMVWTSGWRLASAVRFVTGIYILFFPPKFSDDAFVSTHSAMLVVLVFLVLVVCTQTS